LPAVLALARLPQLRPPPTCLEADRGSRLHPRGVSGLVEPAPAGGNAATYRAAVQPHTGRSCRGPGREVLGAGLPLWGSCPPLSTGGVKVPPNGLKELRACERGPDVQGVASCFQLGGRVRLSLQAGLCTPAVSC